MRLKRVEISKYRNFENVVINFDKNDNFPDVFSLASKNGGGKSTLLQFIFILLSCFLKEERKQYIINLLDEDEYVPYSDLVMFTFEYNKKEYLLNIDFDLSENYNFKYITNMSMEFLIKVSNNIYLTVPEAQPLHFLSKDDDISKLKELLPNFSTYNFPTEKDILQSFTNAKEEDFEDMRINGKYGTNYIDFKKTLKDFIEGKEIGENKDATKIVFKLKGNEELLLEDLSHGEMRKLGIYIWLKNRVKKDSIILMDEVDIALHPLWQYELVDDLVKWSKGSQFLLATHSPQILSSTYYKNLIILDQEDGKVSLKQLKEAPLDRDINVILSNIMGSGYFPKYLKNLHIEYRNLFENGQVDSKKAKELKLEILEYESENSSFFQGIAFDKEVQDI